jgi:F420-dependent oxidoreductase-like protein
MRIGTQLSYAGNFVDMAEEAVQLERAGLDIVFVPEAYSFDAVSQLGYLAAKTERVELASGILQIYTRTPSLTAMTAAGLDYVSGGRFTLGLGASGPQVIEGFHGVRYDAPLARTREIIDICRQVWRRERLVHEGKRYPIPLPAEKGTGLGKPLKLINQPVREQDPDPARLARPEERGADRRARRRVGADLLLSGEGRRCLGRVAGRRQGQAGSGARRAGHRREHAAGHR